MEKELNEKIDEFKDYILSKGVNCVMFIGNDEEVKVLGTGKKFSTIHMVSEALSENKGISEILIPACVFSTNSSDANKRILMCALKAVMDSEADVSGN